MVLPGGLLWFPQKTFCGGSKDCLIGLTFFDSMRSSSVPFFHPYVSSVNFKILILTVILTISLNVHLFGPHVYGVIRFMTETLLHQSVTYA